MTGARAAGPGFLRTLLVLLWAARRRTAGRLRRQAEMRRKRRASFTGLAPAFGLLALGFFAAIVHVATADDIGEAVRTAETLVADGAPASLPDLVALAVVLVWGLMLVCQGEGPETDASRVRQPMWEFLFSHPAPPGAIFLAEMLSPIIANPMFLAAPLFAGVLFGQTYGFACGLLGAALAGIPATVALACLGKALEINIMLRLSAGTRGAMLGIMGWLGFATGMLALAVASSMQTIVRTAAGWLAPLGDLPVPPVRALIGRTPDGTYVMWQGIGLCAALSALVAALSVALALAGARGGLVGLSAGKVAKARVAKAGGKAGRFGRDPLFRKELLWFARDRRALVQAVLVPVSLAAMQTFNFRIVVARQDGATAICGLAILFGTYFLLTLGPQSLASEGTALWIAQTWPRGLESLLKAKAKLWAALATAVVGIALAYALWRYPGGVVAILAVAAMWIVFARSLAEKTVTLATVASSSGEQQRVPAGRRWAALLGTFAFASGVLTHQWPLAITGVVYSVMTAAAMWQNFRFRLPYLSDPWSEVLPQAPTLMHAMIAIAAMVEAVSIVTGIAVGLFGRDGLATIVAFAYSICAIVAALAVGGFLRRRGVTWRDIWIWRDDADAPAEGSEAARTALLAVAGAAMGAALGASALLYLSALHWWPDLAKTIDAGRRHMAEHAELRWSYAFVAVVCAPFAEEYLFRGLLYRALDREWGGWRAVLGAGAFFAIYHPALSWLPVGALGAMNALLFKRTGRLAPAVAAHMAYNAIVLLPVFL